MNNIDTAKIKITVISGYFNPIHIGHLDYIEAARRLGDELWVIVNSDEQVKLKGSVPFQNENDRFRIVKSLSSVDAVFISTDKDHSVITTLQRIYHMVSMSGGVLGFANGGDRKAGNTREENFCSNNGIETAYSVGGKKVQSSSNLIKEVST